MTKLENCPFCGGKATLHPKDQDKEKPFWIVGCGAIIDMSGLYGGCLQRDNARSTYSYVSAEKAIEQWNTRQAAPVDVESLKANSFDENFSYDPYDCAESAKQGWNDCLDFLATSGLLSGVPDGYVLAREEPTEEMCLIGVSTFTESFGSPLTRQANSYKAMIAAGRK